MKMSLSPSSYNRTQLNQSIEKENLSNSVFDKDGLISQLKAQIFDLEQNEKNYQLLQNKYKNLSNDSSILNEEKLRLEYELKQKTETTNKIISDLQTENENLQNALNEKLATNKTLFNDNNNLYSSLEAKTAECEQLKNLLNERDNIIEKLTEEKRNNEKVINDLSMVKNKNETNIQKMDQDLQNLSKTCEEQDRIIDSLTKDKKNLGDDLDNAKYQINNLNVKLKTTNENLSNTSKQLDDANKAIARLDEQLNDTEQQLARVQTDLNSTCNQLAQEKRAHEEFLDKSDRLEQTLKEKLNDIKMMNNEIVNLNSNLERVNLDKGKANNDIEKYKAHIMFLTETNQKLLQELEDVVDRDNKIRAQLERGEHIGDFLNQTRQNIDNALNNLEMSLSRKSN